MSIVERLFPASELEALRATPYDFDLEPTAKRRKLSSTPSLSDSEPRSTFSSDSGYSSDESNPIPDSRLSSRKRSRSSLSTAAQSASPGSPSTQSTLFRKYLSSMHPLDSAKYRLRTHSDPSATSDDLENFYQQITLSRSRTRNSISGLPTPPYSNGGSSRPHSFHDGLADDSADSCVGDVGQGWTAGPKSAAAASISARIFDGIRITTHERSLLHSLIPDSLPPLSVGTQAEPQTETVTPAFTYPPRRGTQTETQAPASSSFPGIAIGAYDDDEDEIEDVDDFDLDGAGTGKVEDFFNIEEASSEDSSSAATVEPAGTDTYSE